MDCGQLFADLECGDADGEPDHDATVEHDGVPGFDGAVQRGGYAGCEFLPVASLQGVLLGELHSK